MFNFLVFVLNLKEKTTYTYSVTRHNYPFPDKAGQIGLLWFSATTPQEVHRVLNMLPGKTQVKQDQK